MRTFLTFSIRTICAWALLFNLAGCEKNDTLPAVEQAFTPNFTLAKTNNELKAIQANPRANIVRSKQDLNALIASNKSPLSKLTPTDREQFINSLVFRQDVGVVSFYCGEITSKLSYEDMAQVVAAFGLDAKQGYWGLSQDPAIKQQLLTGGSLPSGHTGKVSTLDDDQLQQESGDHNGYACISKGNCYKATGWICLSGC